jgi:4-hydroxy-tetrahydrodipicolinate reductase
MIKVILNGYSGKMGLLLENLIDQTEDFSLVSGHDENNPISDASEGNMVIDFSSKPGFMQSLEYAYNHQLHFLSGTTAIGEDAHEKLNRYSQTIPIFYSPNMSLGINFLAKILKENHQFLQRWDLGILESHHRAKKDAPSGTALMLADMLPGSVPTHSFRMGDIPGDHSIIAAQPGELIEFKHRATSRKVFAQGALEVARWFINCPRGLYSMQDYFNFS